MATNRPNGATLCASRVDELIMDGAEQTAASVERLAAEFPAVSRRDIEQVVAEAWVLFRGSAGDEVLRVVATEWYARNELAARDPASPAPIMQISTSRPVSSG